MAESLNLKIASYSTPLFENCSKATTIPAHPLQRVKSYLVLPATQFINPTSGNSISPTYVDSQKHNCLIQLQGECLHKYLLSRRHELAHRIMQQDQIWNMIAGISSAFHTLRRLGLADKYTHFKEYCVRRIPDMHGHIYKLIYHQQMTSQLDIAKQGVIPWHTLYLSPQQLALTFYPQHSIVFSLGLMLLHICANCDRSRTIYKKDKYQISKSAIQHKLKIASQKYGYSKTVIEFIRKCLAIHPKDRFNFEGLWRSVDKLVETKRLNNWQLLAAILHQQHYPQQCEGSSLDNNISQESQTHKYEAVGRIRTQVASLPKQLVEPTSRSSSSSPRSSKNNESSSPIDKFYAQKQDGNGKLYQSRQQEEQEQSEDYVSMRPHDITENEEYPKQMTHTKIEIQITQTRMLDKSQSHRQQEDNYQNQPSNTLIRSEPPSADLQDPQTRTGCYRYSIHQVSIPAPLTQLQSLSLFQCLKPISELVKTIGKIGVWIEGDVYYGNFIKGKREGLGLEVYADGGGYYYGYFKEDLYEGEGLYLWNQAQYYFGLFKAGEKVRGRLEGPIKYQGQFENNKRHGQGTCWYPTGQIYSGGWQNDKRQGEGFVIQADGPKFVGNWQAGRRKGEGYLQTDVMRIAGNWNNQRIQGETLIEYSNGDAFRGITNEKLQKIEGDYISNKGQIFKGYFQGNQPKRGKLIYSNGEYYIGELVDMRRQGYGQYHYKNGQVCQGLWEDNQIKEIKTHALYS